VISLKKLAVMATVISTALLMPLTADAAAATWTVMPTQDTVTEVSLSSVACPSLSFCVALGVNGPQPLVFTWNGSTWALSATPGQPDETTMTAVSCTSATNCLAVGYNFLGSSAGKQAAAWLFNGSSWDEVTANSPMRWNSLNAIKCLSASDCEAVGWQSQHAGYGYQPLAEVWNGSTWSTQGVKGANGTVTGQLSAVACAAAASCEAVGSRPAGSQSTAALAVRWAGTTWTSQKLPAVTSRSYLTGVTCYKTGCTAVGAAATASGLSTLAEAWNGTHWALQSPVGSGNVTGATDTIWNAVHCQSAASCVVVGNWDSNNTLAETWNGSTWAQDSTPNPTASDVLNALSCTPGTAVCTAVGVGGDGDPPFAVRN
jgi:hypothetical protein